MKRDFVSILDFSRSEIEELFSVTDFLRSNNEYKPLLGKSAALIFQKPSLRTRVSFEVGVHELGGHPIFLSQEGIGIGEREKAKDIARLLSRYTGVIIARLFEHSTLLELAEHSTVPVVNALTDLSHPCQVLADVYTLKKLGKLRENAKIVFIGDGNNIVNSWLEFATIFPLHFVLAAPPGYYPDPELLKKAQTAGIGKVEIVKDPSEAAHNADVLYTDVWVSMGQEKEAKVRRKAFKGYQVSEMLLSSAKPDSVVMHCLPAHRDEEITDAVLEGSHSVVFEQAENRLHVQKAILAKILGFKLDGKLNVSLRTSQAKASS
ncbi:MAG: ornithine carbamoyltransferase [Ignavibacteriales bacterium]|nr:ornithine carbamoyltransferase [Ignavibacteriales bacterium]